VQEFLGIVEAFAFHTKLPAHSVGQASFQPWLCLSIWVVLVTLTHMILIFRYKSHRKSNNNLVIQMRLGIFRICPRSSMYTGCLWTICESIKWGLSQNAGSPSSPWEVLLGLGFLLRLYYKPRQGGILFLYTSRKSCKLHFVNKKKKAGWRINAKTPSSFISGVAIW